MQLFGDTTEKNNQGVEIPEFLHQAGVLTPKDRAGGEVSKIPLSPCHTARTAAAAGEQHSGRCPAACPARGYEVTPLPAPCTRCSRVLLNPARAWFKILEDQELVHTQQQLRLNRDNDNTEQSTHLIKHTWLFLRCCLFLIINEDAPSNAGGAQSPLAQHGWHPGLSRTVLSPLSVLLSSGNRQLFSLITYELNEICFSCAIKLPVVCNLHFSELCVLMGTLKCSRSQNNNSYLSLQPLLKGGSMRKL